MRIAVCCAMNQNRSMQAHQMLLSTSHTIYSYGTSTQIKIPGPSINLPNIYPFTSTYNDIYQDLLSKDKDLYKKNGMLHMLERNMSIKDKPENFFDAINNGMKFDLVITCDKRCFWTIYENIEVDKGNFWLVNFDVKDTPNDAIIGASNINIFIELIREGNVDNAIKEYGEMKKMDMLFFYVVGCVENECIEDTNN